MEDEERMNHRCRQKKKAAKNRFQVKSKRRKKRVNVSSSSVICSDYQYLLIIGESGPGRLSQSVLVSLVHYGAQVVFVTF